MLISHFDGIGSGDPNPISGFTTTFALFHAIVSFIRVFGSNFIFTTDQTILFRVFTVLVKIGIRVKVFVTIFSLIRSRDGRITELHVSELGSGHGFLGESDSHVLDLIGSCSLGLIVQFLHDCNFLGRIGSLVHDHILDVSLHVIDFSGGGVGGHAFFLHFSGLSLVSLGTFVRGFELFELFSLLELFQDFSVQLFGLGQFFILGFLGQGIDGQTGDLFHLGVFVGGLVGGSLLGFFLFHFHFSSLDVSDGLVFDLLEGFLAVGFEESDGLDPFVTVLLHGDSHHGCEGTKGLGGSFHGVGDGETGGVSGIGTQLYV